ncbi:ribosome biogenesis GTPase YlqF [Methylococcaceae bacterium HT1]|uniref:ribosome biogenesis GTPase YlqF n=1 Tax=Bathymodiolus platifrons methanotrophic gill symbiont TaxID=113268 RepID=UPI0011CC0708|nr:ribosome biogenesis GTPase YlqF [Bathymodiolus platifrons methanotrophic gill symbiont]TXK98985.1 ribosome biogenesis GTPase YlqF [Methylococcaceae bacterium HT1]TXL12951.1 ribosome biogenesis GTPase YlqF [Methylococcaceae bacterium HT3]TXL22028.1 ribosome biogenesis GTPase YlqF [Methylococcaceae bacterium HT2]
MKIQWFPGHMYKAGKEIKETLPDIDLLIEILDARLPFSSANPLLSEIRGDKPCIKILNKADLADPTRTQQWQDFLEQEDGVKTLALTAIQTDKVDTVIELCRKIIPHKTTANKVMHMLIMGIPNVGKSTLINALAGRTIAKTGNEPAVTKRQQRIDLHNGIILCDTPGMLWPNLENQNTGYRLATTGAIKDTALKHDDVASFAGEFFLHHYPESLKQRYQIDTLPASDYDLLQLIGKKRGCLRSGGQIDIDKVAKILLTEIRDGTLGRITLETPEMMQTELAELTIIRAKKEAKKEKRKKNWKSER